MWSILFPPDYWSMSNEDLAALAARYHIPQAVLGPGGQAALDRPYMIKAITERDTFRRSNIALLSAIASLVLTLVNLGLVFVPRPAVQQGTGVSQEQRRP